MKSEEIYEILKKRLEEGVYAPGSRFPSESRLLEEFDVSKVTVNKIVSRLAAQELLVRGVRGAGTRVAASVFRPKGCIAFIGTPSSYCMRIQKGIQQECMLQGFFPVVFTPGAEELQYCLGMLSTPSVVGMISLGFGKLKCTRDIPVVCLDFVAPHQRDENGIHFIDSDNFSGGRQMMAEILRRGHKNIGIFSSERFVFGAQAGITPRVRGFHAALQEHGMGERIGNTFYGMPDSLPDAKLCLAGVLKRRPVPTVICTDSDGSADLLFRAAEAAGIALQGKVCITGFGNVTHRPIATVDQHPERQGQLAVRYIQSMLNRQTEITDQESLVETSLVGTEYIPIIK